MISQAEAEAITEDWIAAWNAHDLDAIMAHYAENIQFWSPLVIKRLGNPTGKIENKAQLRAYFAQGLERSKDLHFTLLSVFVGVDSITLHYRRQDHSETSEIMVLDEANHQVRLVRVHYNPPL